MAELEIRPTMRFIRLGYLAIGVLLVAAVAWWVNRQDTLSLAAVAAATLLLLWPAIRHLNRQRICCRLEGDHLRYESGIFTTTVKTLQVSKIQDVTVRRTLTQRMWGIGDLRIETAGQSSALGIRNVEDPQKCAERILASAGKTPSPA